MTLAQTIMCEQALGLVDRNTLLNLPDLGLIFRCLGHLDLAAVRALFQPRGVSK